MSVNRRSNMHKELSVWKGGKETFEYEKEKVLIEDYDDESSCSEDNDNSVDKTKLNLVKRNLTESFELDQLLNVKCKLLLNNRSNEELNFGLESQDDTFCDDMLSDKSICIQEELTQESASSQIVQIECSSSPQTKSLQVNKCMLYCVLSKSIQYVDDVTDFLTDTLIFVRLNLNLSL